MVYLRSKSCRPAVLGCTHAVMMVSYSSGMCVLVFVKSGIADSIGSLIIFSKWSWMSTMPSFESVVTSSTRSLDISFVGLDMYVLIKRYRVVFIVSI